MHSEAAEKPAERLLPDTVEPATDRPGRGLREKTLKAVLWATIQHGGGHFIAFLVFLVLARLLSPRDFGVVAMANVFVALVQSVSGQGLASAVIQAGHLSKEQLDSAFWGSVGTGVVSAAVAVAAAGYIAELMAEPSVPPLVRALAPLLVLLPLQRMPEALLKRELEFKVVALRRILSITLSGSVAICLAYFGAGAWSLVAHQLVAQTANVAILWGASGWRPRLSFSWQAYRSLLPYGLNVSGYSLLNFVYRGADEMVVGYLLGPVVLGFYNVAHRILRLLNMVLVDTVAQVAFPLFSRLQSERARLVRAFLEASELAGLWATPAFLLFCMLAPELVPLVLGEQWTASVSILQILVLGGVLRAFAFANYPLLAAVGKPGWRLHIHLLRAVLTLGGVALLGRMGIEVVASAVVVVSLACLPVEIFVVKSLIRFELSRYLRGFVVPGLAGAAMIAAIALLRRHGPDLSGYWGLLVRALGGVCAYAFAVLLMAPAAVRRTLGYVRLVAARRKVPS